MTIKELLEIVDSSYPNGDTREHHDEDGNVLHDVQAGDTLAEFVVSELVETFDPDWLEADQIDHAMNKLLRAQEDLQCVIDALRKKQKEVGV